MDNQKTTAKSPEEIEAARRLVAKKQMAKLFSKQVLMRNENKNDTSRTRANQTNESKIGGADHNNIKNNIDNNPHGNHNHNNQVNDDNIEDLYAAHITILQNCMKQDDYEDDDDYNIGTCTCEYRSKDATLDLLNVRTKAYDRVGQALLRTSSTKGLVSTSTFKLPSDGDDNSILNARGKSRENNSGSNNSRGNSRNVIKSDKSSRGSSRKKVSSRQVPENKEIKFSKRDALKALPELKLSNGLQIILPTHTTLIEREEFHNKIYDFNYDNKELTTHSTTSTSESSAMMSDDKYIVI
jgi:hypothetical protein